MKENRTRKYVPISYQTEKIASMVINSAYTVHKKLGPGLLEKIYEACFCYELQKRNIKFHRQVTVPIVYDSVKFKEGLRLDVFVENCIICELKALDIINPLWEAQLISHLKLTNARLGFLINFNVALIKNGIRRFVV